MLFSKKEREFQKIYSDYFPLVYSVLYTKLGSKEDSEDICHEIFIDFYNKYETVNEPRTWLLGAIRFGISNFYRKKGASGSDKIDIEDVENDIKLAFENGARDVRIILEEVFNDDENFQNEQERILFELITIHEFTYEKAGKQLGINRNQAKYLYGKICNRLVKYLQEKGIAHIEDVL